MGGLKGAKKVFMVINKNRVLIGEFTNGIFKPNKWISGGDKVVEVLENQRYINEAGKEVTGTLEVIKDGSEVGVRAIKNWASEFPKLAAKAPDWEILGLIYEQVDDVIKIVSRNGDEIGKVTKQGGEEVFEISDDFFIDGVADITKQFDMKVVSNAGDNLINARLVKVGDQVGFIEDVSSYGNVKNTIKKRGNLRKALTGIKATEDAHHLIPVQLLKQNDVVKKAVEAGFEFNTTKNGLAIEKFVKKTGAGRHGPHPKYTEQINQALERFKAQTPNYTSQQAKEFLEIITDDIKNTIQTTSGKINDLNLGL